MMLSTIIPAGGDFRLLRQTINSVLEHSHNVQIVASGNRTRLRQELKDMNHTGNIVLSESSGSGESAAINSALNLCSGALINILRPGEKFTKDTLNVVARGLQQWGEQTCFYGDAEVVDKTGKELGFFTTDPDWRSRRKRHCRFSPASFFYRKDFLVRAGGLDQSLNYWAEYDLWLRLDSGACKFTYLPGILAQRLLVQTDNVQSEFCVLPSKASADELLRVRIGADTSSRISAHLASHGEICAAIFCKERAHFLLRTITATRHISNAFKNSSPAFNQSLPQHFLTTAHLLRRLWRTSSRREFCYLPLNNTPEVKARFFTRKVFELTHYTPRPMRLPDRYLRTRAPANLPLISIITPSYNQCQFLESAIVSVVDQNYPALEYIVQDGGSDDDSVSTLRKHETSLAHWESQQDGGQVNALNRGFERSKGEIMAYLNADDVLLPGSLSYVANFFCENPGIDIVYGHRVLINSEGQEVGRWVLPSHDDQAIQLADFIPQETMFWRRSAWDAVGGHLDESFKFAMDWDLILRFRAAGLTFRRLPRFLGAFRVWQDQKTQTAWFRQGLHESRRLIERSTGSIPRSPERNSPLGSYIRRQWLLDRMYRLGLVRY